MSLLDDVVNGIVADITAVGLLKGPNPATDEVTGGGYARQLPTWGASSAGTAALTAAVPYDGPANDGPITHVLFVRGAKAEVVRPVSNPTLSFNSDGRIDIATLPITAAFAS
jgi:hypothetical protein